MGRPLKIQKFGPAQGITYPNSTSANIPAAGVPVDQGYPQFSQLTDPEYYSSLTPSNFYGVVGGNYTTSSPSATFPIVKCAVNIQLPDGSGAGVQDGRIIRQKGAHKYLVASGTTVEDENCVVGAAYQILSLDTTNWQQMGAPVGAIPGTIFTCTAVCASPQNGTALLVGQCVLTSDLTPGPGLMSISYAVGGDSTEVAVSRLTNKFLQNWDNFQNAAGTSIDSYASGGNNAGPVNYSGEGTFLANFFTDDAGAQATKSGADAETFSNGTGDIELAQVEKFTS
jgi:hypothetical protein